MEFESLIVPQVNIPKEARKNSIQGEKGYAIICYQEQMSMTGTRRKARSTALQTLYEIDSVRRDADAVVERHLADIQLSEENKTFTRELVHGVVGNKSEIDQNIKKFAPAWPPEQLAIIDRNILRLAIFEILFDNKVPVKVAVSEAIELAKSYGSENSSKFVNGVLGSVSALASR